MKKFFTAVMFALVAFLAIAIFPPREAQALVGSGTQFKLIIDGLEVSVLVDGHLDQFQSMTLSDGDTIHATFTGGCTPMGQGNWHVGFVETLQRNPNGTWSVTSTQQLEIGPGCESASWTFHTGGLPNPCIETSSYCPCSGGGSGQ